MTCNCIDAMDKTLKEHNGKLGLTYTVNFKDGEPGGAYPTLVIEKLEKRGKKPPLPLPTFCPFCGTRYHEKPTRLKGDEG